MEEGEFEKEQQKQLWRLVGKVLKSKDGHYQSVRKFKQYIGCFYWIAGNILSETEADTDKIIDYGNTGCGVFKNGIQNLKGFC